MAPTSQGPKPSAMPSPGYEGLEVAEGGTASHELERLMFAGDRMEPAERDHLGDALRRYCAQDTLALVRLVERLRELAG